MDLKDYRKQLKKATPKEQIAAISYGALKDDPTVMVFSKKWDKIVDMCIRREEELGLR